MSAMHKSPVKMKYNDYDAVSMNFAIFFKWKFAVNEKCNEFFLISFDFHAIFSC